MFDNCNYWSDNSNAERSADWDHVAYCFVSSLLFLQFVDVTRRSTRRTEDNTAAAAVLMPLHALMISRRGDMKIAQSNEER